MRLYSARDICLVPERKLARHGICVENVHKIMSGTKVSGEWLFLVSSIEEMGLQVIVVGEKFKIKKWWWFFKEDMVNVWTFLLQGAAGAESLYGFKGECPSSWERNPLCITKTSETVSGLGSPWAPEDEVGYLNTGGKCHIYSQHSRSGKEGRASMLWPFDSLAYNFLQFC